MEIKGPMKGPRQVLHFLISIMEYLKFSYAKHILTAQCVKPTSNQM